MLVSSFALGLSRFLILPSLLSTAYLYLYPLVYGCGFLSQDGHTPSALAPLTSLLGTSSTPVKAPFRLLVFADPQLEGDTSLPDPDEPFFPYVAYLWDNELDLSWSEAPSIVRKTAHALFAQDVPRRLEALRKRIDLLGNDFYLAHIYRTLHWWTEPTHVTVLGDLLGSQWIDDEEFERRSWRFWHRVFKRAQRVDDSITGGKTVEVLGEDLLWNRRIINVAGNHDVGYAGDMTKDRLERFEASFGKASWEITFRLPVANGSDTSAGRVPDAAPELRIVVLNTMNLDTPAFDGELQRQTYDFINGVITGSKPVEDRSTGTILLTHIPLHKEAGICVDGPFFDFHAEGSGWNGVKEQNHISHDAGKGILEGIYGMSSHPHAVKGGIGRNGIILNGHDHHGCDTYHFIPAEEQRNDTDWHVTRWQNARQLVNEGIPGIREVTLRSMMGEFGGNAGLLSAWFDESLREWRFELTNCPLGIQHIWWAVHILDFVTVLSLGVALLGHKFSTLSAEGKCAEGSVTTGVGVDRCKREPSFTGAQSKLSAEGTGKTE